MPEPVGVPNPTQLLALGVIARKLRGPGKPDQSERMVPLSSGGQPGLGGKVDQLLLNAASCLNSIPLRFRLTACSFGLGLACLLGTQPETNRHDGRSRQRERHRGQRRGDRLVSTTPPPGSL